MRLTPIVALVVAPALLAGQATPLRPVANNRFTSLSAPAASFSVDPTYRFLGAQTIDILKVAGADQYFFAQVAPDSTIERFYWLQFEHYYSSNQYTYDYSELPQDTISLGPLRFIGDARELANYLTTDKRPGSDSQAAAQFLRRHGVRLEGTFARLRLFHLPDSTRRRELMIIYGERLPRPTPASELRDLLVSHARAGLTVQ